MRAQATDTLWRRHTVCSWLPESGGKYTVRGTWGAGQPISHVRRVPPCTFYSKPERSRERCHVWVSGAARGRGIQGAGLRGGAAELRRGSRCEGCGREAGRPRRSRPGRRRPVPARCLRPLARQRRQRRPRRQSGAASRPAARSAPRRRGGLFPPPPTPGAS